MGKVRVMGGNDGPQITLHYQISFFRLYSKYYRFRGRIVIYFSIEFSATQTLVYTNSHAMVTHGSLRVG